MPPGRIPQAVAAAPIPAAAGVGLRFPHHDAVLNGTARAAWFEIHPENYLGDGVAGEILDGVARDFPLSFHATGLSLGAADGVDPGHLGAIAELCRRFQPGLVSDHLSWSSSGGMFLPDLLPLPYTRVNNVAVSAANLGEEPGRRLQNMLAALPPAAIGEIHLAGHAVRPLPDGGAVLIDDHGSRVSDAVWALYETVLRHIGPRPSLIEWDTAIPAFAVLADEARIADGIMAAASEVRHAAAG